MTTDLILIIDHRDTTVRMNGRALRVQRADAAPEHVPLGVLGLVIVQGSPMVSCDVWRALAERNIPAVLVPGRGRGQSALIGAALSNTIALRAAQHRAAADPGATLVIARHLVAAKLNAQIKVLEYLDRTGTAARKLVRQHLVSVDTLGSAHDNAAVMGVEGAAAAAWYAWLADCLAAHWRFSGRNRRPPLDPVNALLSLGYTLLGGEMLRAVQAHGLDPAMGFLHGMVPGRESLVLDLMEPLRPSVDLVVLGLLDTRLEPCHFSFSQGDGCRLNKTGRGLFYSAWANTRPDWPDLFGTLTEQPETSLDEDAERHDLPALCRRRVERLRTWLRPYLSAEALVPTEENPSAAGGNEEESNDD